jgi:hypothetical protein
MVLLNIQGFKDFSSWKGGTMDFADEGKVQPAGTQYLGLIDSLIDLLKNKDVSDVEVVFISYKLDSKGERSSQ